MNLRRFDLRFFKSPSTYPGYRHVSYNLRVSWNGCPRFEIGLHHKHGKTLTGLEIRTAYHRVWRPYTTAAAWDPAKVAYDRDESAKVDLHVGPVGPITVVSVPPDRTVTSTFGGCDCGRQGDGHSPTCAIWRFPR